MKFISFFIHNINSIKMKKDIFSSDTKKYPNTLEFSLIKNYFFLRKYMCTNIYLFYY